MKILIKSALIIASTAFSLCSPLNCSQPVTLVSCDGASFAIDRSAAMASKTIAAILANPGFAEGTTNEINFSRIESHYLAPLVQLLSNIKPNAHPSELITALESQDQINQQTNTDCCNTSIINLEFLDIVNFLKIKPLKHTLASMLIQKMHPQERDNRELMKVVIKKLPAHLQGLILTYWFLNFRGHCGFTEPRYLFPIKELRTLSGFGFTLEQLVESGKLLNVHGYRNCSAYFSMLFLKNLNLPVENRAAIKFLTASTNLLRTMPNLASFQNLLTLDLSDNQINTIDPEALKQTPELTELDLSNNRLETIPEGLFVKTPLLERINLNNNRIRSLTTKPFEGLTKLSDLHLCTNPLDKPSKESLNNFSDISKNPCRLVFTDPE